MTPRTKIVACRKGEETEMIRSLEDLTALTPVKFRRNIQKKTAIDYTMTDIHLDPGLEGLVRLRVAQIHGCKWSMHEHTKMLKAEGETTRRLRLLKNWRQQTVFCSREKAALNLAEALTRTPINSIPKEAVYVARVFFDKTAMICLTLVILAANDWHYLNDSFSPPNFFEL